jgi:MerR family Zn(II)-responsive transcriptional regulator of zntA
VEAKQNPNGTIRAGELARLSGVSRDTLRHYERNGLLRTPFRSANGYRVFPTEALQRIRLIRGALSIGFTVKELGRILRLRDSGQAPCREVRNLAMNKLGELESRIREMLQLRDSLRRAIRAWDRRLKTTPRGRPAGLLESFVAKYPGNAEIVSPLVSPGLRKKLKEGKERI